MSSTLSRIVTIFADDLLDHGQKLDVAHIKDYMYGIDGSAPESSKPNHLRLRFSQPRAVADLPSTHCMTIAWTGQPGDAWWPSPQHQQLAGGYLPAAPMPGTPMPGLDLGKNQV